MKQVYSKKTLGVLIDDNLCWNEQIDNISKKVSKGIGMLRRAKPFVSFETLKYIYQALVQPPWFGETVGKVQKRSYRDYKTVQLE